jgi:hypothetical protein
MILKFIFYVPKSHLDQVKEAVFKAGAGSYGNYANCCWQTLGLAEFTPLAGSEPYIGRTGLASQVEEYRVETICQEDQIQAVIAALKASHPYQWPVYDAWPLSYYSSAFPY